MSRPTECSIPKLTIRLLGCSVMVAEMQPDVVAFVGGPSKDPHTTPEPRTGTVVHAGSSSIADQGR